MFYHKSGRYHSAATLVNSSSVGGNQLAPRKALVVVRIEVAAGNPEKYVVIDPFR